MKKGLHNAAILTATVNLLYVAAVMIFWLCNGVGDITDILILSVPIDIIYVIVSALFLIGICRAKGNVLACIYWAAIIAEPLLCLFIGGTEVMGFFGALVLSAVVILVITLLRNKLNFKLLCVIISLVAAVMIGVELWFIIECAPLGAILITVFYPWMPAVPLLPILATILLTAAQKAE